MSDRVFSVDEVNAALRLVTGDSTQIVEVEDQPIFRIRGWWNFLGAYTSHIAALALGVLPEGWRLATDRRRAGCYLWCDEAVDWYVSIEEGLYGGNHGVSSDNWPEAVRSGQAEIACRLLAAHVELERLRAGGVK